MFYNRKCKITYICHGATIYSEEFRFSDAEHYPPLNEAGYDEMGKICGFLKLRGVKNDKIYTSPAVRTVQSAKMIAKLYKKDYIVLDDLHPKSCGIWNGLTIEQIEAKNKSALREMFQNPDEKRFGEKESLNEFTARVGRIIDEIVVNDIGNRIIIVTHPEIIQAAICNAIGLSPQNMPKIYIRTGSATQISYYEDWTSLKYSGYIPLDEVSL